MLPGRSAIYLILNAKKDAISCDRSFYAIVALLFLAVSTFARPCPTPTAIAAQQQNGQTFISWIDAAPGPAGQSYRYRLYRSTAGPIGATSRLKPIQDEHALFNNSAMNPATVPAFTQVYRSSADSLMLKIRENAPALPAFTGLAVYTNLIAESAWYAVTTVSKDGSCSESAVTPDVNSLAAPIAESSAPLRPVLQLAAASPCSGPSCNSWDGTARLPGYLWLHGSFTMGNWFDSKHPAGDLWAAWGSPAMSYADGRPFSWYVYQNRGQHARAYGQDILQIQPRDSIWWTSGEKVFETDWKGSIHTDGGYFHQDTEARLAFIVDQMISHYRIDPNRVVAGGQSMGILGSIFWAFRHPEIFCAVFPSLMVRWAETTVPSLPQGYDLTPRTQPALTASYPLMAFDRAISYAQYYDAISFIHHRGADALPFVGWGVGRSDPNVTWSEQVRAANTLKANKRAFAVNWNNADHAGSQFAIQPILDQYLFAFRRDRSYPAFFNFSLDANMGSGAPGDGDLQGCINCGWRWSIQRDEKTSWSATVVNAQIKGKTATADIVPSNTQTFHPGPGASVSWTATGGQKGSAVADRYGLVTAAGVQIGDAETTITFTVDPGR